MLNKQKKYENAIIINDSAHIDRIIKKPREGKVYIYHQGFVARDRGKTKFVKMNILTY